MNDLTDEDLCNMYSCTQEDLDALRAEKALNDEREAERADVAGPPGPCGSRIEQS